MIAAFCGPERDLRAGAGGTGEMARAAADIGSPTGWKTSLCHGRVNGGLASRADRHGPAGTGLFRNSAASFRLSLSMSGAVQPGGSVSATQPST